MKDDVLKQAAWTLSVDEVKELRKARRESQAKFWKRFGVTQSRGSRIEQGLGMPAAVAILVKLYLEGKVSDGDLWRARRGSGAMKQMRIAEQHV
ncbi:MAG TPA: helix-turn-helix transcriptional regulator [Methylophilaceae bacterium]|nr:helix-turn-helix transcriptional regulator [Methylophilaceae bacterium]